MHIIQQKILSQLINQSGLRFSKLRPKGIESNHFVYHLKSLIRDKFIKKVDNLYQLTVKGKQYADKLSFKDFKPRIQPKIVTLLICKNKESEYLWQKRNKEPFHGLTSLPYGKLHLGEKIEEAAKRELQEKTNMIGKLKHVGDQYWLIQDGGEIVSHMLCHVFEVGNSMLLKNKQLPDDCFWSKLDKIKKSDLIPGTKQLVESKNFKTSQIIAGNL